MAASAGMAVGAARALANKAGRARTVKRLFMVVVVEVVVVFGVVGVGSKWSESVGDGVS